MGGEQTSLENKASQETSRGMPDSSSRIVFRALQASDAPEVARIWRAGLSQTSQSQNNPFLKCAMSILLKKMEVQALGKRGDVGPEGRNLAKRWGGAEYPCSDLSSCKLMLVAVDKDRNAVVGCCGVKRGTDEQKDVEDPEKTDVFSVWRLSVSEDARGEGLGRKLMDHVEEWARLRGGKKMQLYTGNPAASKFYQKLGYSKTSAFAHEKSLLTTKLAACLLTK